MPAQYIVMIMMMLVIVVCAGLYVYKKQYMRNIDELKERKKLLLEGVPTQRLEEVRQMTINGKSQDYADKLEAMWQDIHSGRNIEVENYVMQTVQAIERYRFNDAGKYQQQAHESLEAIESDLMRLATSLEDLIYRQEANLKRIDAAQTQYDHIRTTLLDNSVQYGQSIDLLEEGLAQIEEEFNRFVKITKWGDHEEARDVIEQVEQMIAQMDQFMTDIPILLVKITDDYQPQLDEIVQSYNQLMRENYVFNGQPIPKQVEQTEVDIEELQAAVGDLDLVKARHLAQTIESTVDDMYDRLEHEMVSKEHVDTLLPDIQKAIYYLKEEVRVLFFEIDRISQSYVLIHNEQQAIKQLKLAIEEQSDLYDRIVDNLSNHFTPYSEADTLLQHIKDTLTNLNQDKNDVTDQLYQYRDKEIQLKDQLAKMKKDLQRYKRQLMRENLPGVPTEYDEFYHYVSRLVKSLEEELSRPRLKVEKIYDIKAMCEEELNTLAQDTQRVIDDANLTEAMAQSLYQYRDNYPEVNQVIAQGMKLFNEDYDYESSLRVIRGKLNDINPSMVDQVEQRYQTSKQ